MSLVRLPLLDHLNKLAFEWVLPETNYDDHFHINNSAWVHVEDGLVESNKFSNKIKKFAFIEGAAAVPKGRSQVGMMLR